MSRIIRITVPEEGGGVRRIEIAGDFEKGTQYSCRE